MFLLRCRTSYSDPEAPTPEELAERAVQHEVSNLAVTDLDTLDSVVEARETLGRHGISPVVGLEWSGIGGGERLLFYARTLEGYRDLIDLLSRPFDPGSTPTDLGLKSLPDGLFVLCNGPESLFRSLIAKGREREALMMLQRYMEWFGRRALRVVLPPDLGEKGNEEQRLTLGALAREGVRFAALGEDESSGEPLSEEALAEAYVSCPAAVDEGRQVLAGCEFRWEPPGGGLAQVTPGRGYRSESYVWDRCQQVLIQKYGKRRREAEKRLYAEFQAFRDAGLFDLLVALSQVQGRTSLGHPLVWPLNAWVVSTLVGHLLGLSLGDPIRLQLEPEILARGDSAERGVDVTLLLGRGEWERCVETLERIFGKDHVVFRRGKPVGRPPAMGEPDLFSEELAAEHRPTPVTEIIVSRFRWLDFLPAQETEEGHLQTTLPGEITARLPVYRFHLRRDRLLTILTLAARDVSHQGRGLDLFTEPDEVFRSLTGSDGGRGVLRLGIPELSSVETYLRLRQAAAVNGKSSKGRVTLDEALDRVAEAFCEDPNHSAERVQRLITAHKLMAMASLCVNYPRSYYTALFSTVELELGELRKLMAEVMSRGIRVSGPDINQSSAETVVTEEGMRLGLRCIRGIGPVISRSLIGSRERQPFVSLQDLCRRTDRRTVNRAVLDRLIEVGALDRLEGDRAAQKAALAWILGEGEVQEAHPRQLFLFPKGEQGDSSAIRTAGSETVGEGLGWEVFDAESLDAGKETFRDSGAEAVSQLKEGGFRRFVSWGWFVDVFPAREGSGSAWGFFSDGEATIPASFAGNGFQDAPSGPWVIRGRCVGNRAGWRRLIPGTAGAQANASLPIWQADLAAIEVVDIEPLCHAAEEAGRRGKVALRVGQGDRNAFRELVECLKRLQVKGERGGRLRIEGDPGWYRRRRLARLAQRRVLLLDIALRWLGSIPVVRGLHVEDEEGSPLQRHDLSGGDRQVCMRDAGGVSDSGSREA